MKTGILHQPYYAVILKVAGIILILGTLLDYLALMIPPNFLDSVWLAELMGAWVNRAAVPLLGIGLIFLGVWFDRSRLEAGYPGKLPIVAFILSGILGLLFLITAPLYFNSSRLTSAAQTREINQQAAQAEQQLNNLIEQQRARVNAIVSDEDQLAQLESQLDNADLPADQQAQLARIRTTLEQVKSNPQALEQEVVKARAQGVKQIEEKQKAALDQLQAKLRRDRIRVTLSSLIFAVGYLMIAWTGLGRGSSTPKPKVLKPQSPKKRR